MSIDIQTIRKDFPILEKQVYGKPYIYFDSAATTLRPVQVLNAVTKIYTEFNGNPHRGSHYMSNQTTLAYENVRDKVQKFINAPTREEIIFTKGATEGINLVAYSFGDAFITEGDEIIISEMEHHANIVPWQLLAQRKKAILKVLPIIDKGELIVSELDNLITPKTKLIAINMVSNVLGTVNPIQDIIEKAHAKNVKVLIDAAQGIQHIKTDVQKLDCDFLVFSGHKMYGPTGVGCLYGKKELLDAMPPFLSGGEMIDKVSFKGTTFNKLPYKFEAGTPNFTEVIGLGAAIDYVNNIGLDKIAAYEHELLEYASLKLKQIDGMRIFGEAISKASVISFLVGSIHPYDMGMFLDKMGFAVRTGHHCAEPLMDRYRISGTVRISLAIYNTKEEIDQLVDAIKKTVAILG
ncbi:MAG: cysteine desulfurase [Prolixibacteraceae bacterium]|jgi:cysteine desulfurase/selenocysteine lyase|nr:cysteine desulfurase [Prolixibacteraceae bacterium]